MLQCYLSLTSTLKISKLRNIREFYDKHLDKTVITQKIRKFETPGMYYY